MSARAVSMWLLSFAAGSLVLSLPACLNNASVPALSPTEQGVRIDSGDPPAGARLVGPISATHGNGCGITNPRGTEAGATALLRAAAAKRGITFVKLTNTKRPYPGHDCFHQEFTLEGLGYSTSGIKTTAAPAVISPPPAAPMPVASAPVLTPSAAVPVGSSAPVECAPPCSPGYACRAGVCEAECNPPCSADHTCRADRVCVPRAPTP